MDESTSRKVCRLIAGIVVVDADLDEAEDAFVDSILARFGLTSEDREALFPIMDGNEAAEQLRSLPVEVRDEALELLVQAVAVDKRYVKEERAYLHTVAKAIGVSTDEVDKRVEAALTRARA